MVQTNAARWTVLTAILLLCAAPPGFSANTGSSFVETPDKQQNLEPVPAKDARSQALQSISGYVIENAPYKQINPSTGAPNASIGRTPGSACEVMRFLGGLEKAGLGSRATRAKLDELGAWILKLQMASNSEPWRGGVSSAPDLPAPANAYYYAIDAGFCGEAMLAAFDITGEPSYLRSAKAFGDFLLNLARGPSTDRNQYRRYGFCEFVIARGKGTWNCDRHVKNLISSAYLMKLSARTGNQAYAKTARATSDFLSTGLSGAWEYATARSVSLCRSENCPIEWRRIQGPHKESNYFTYGDTLAYSLRALYDLEGPSNQVTTLYDRFASFKGSDDRTRAYDGRIAFAGYMRPDIREPDALSAYYDLVTLGILHNLRRAIRPDHHAAAAVVLRSKVRDARTTGWQMKFDQHIPETEYVDLTTLANLGEALLIDELGAMK